MVLEIEYMMEYKHPGLPVTEDCWLQRKSADSAVRTGKRQLFHVSLPLLRCSLIPPVVPAPMRFCRTVEPPVTGYRGLIHL